MKEGDILIMIKGYIICQNVQIINKTNGIIERITKITV